MRLEFADPSLDPSRSLDLQLATVWVHGTSIKATGFFSIRRGAEAMTKHQSMKVSRDAGMPGF